MAPHKNSCNGENDDVQTQIGHTENGMCGIGQDQDCRKFVDPLGLKFSGMSTFLEPTGLQNGKKMIERKQFGTQKETTSHVPSPHCQKVNLLRF